MPCMHATHRCAFGCCLHADGVLACTPSCRKRSFFDSEMRSLRKQLRDTYESLLFLDAAFAAANDVEGQLWRSVFYMPIEEFRARIRKADKEAQHNSGPVAVVSMLAAAVGLQHLWCDVPRACGVQLHQLLVQTGVERGVLRHTDCMQGNGTCLTSEVHMLR